MKLILILCVSLFLFPNSSSAQLLLKELKVTNEVQFDTTRRGVVYDYQGQIVGDLEVIKSDSLSEYQYTNPFIRRLRVNLDDMPPFEIVGTGKIQVTVNKRRFNLE